MTDKERIIRGLEHLDDDALAEVAITVERLAKKRPAHIHEEISLWCQLAEPFENPEDEAAFEEAVRRRPFFGNRSEPFSADT